MILLLAMGLVAQWITRLTTDQKIPGSNPGKLGNILRIDYIHVLSNYIEHCQIVLV